MTTEHKDLEGRIREVAKVVKQSNDRIYISDDTIHDSSGEVVKNSTGFQPWDPNDLAGTILAILNAGIQSGTVSIDLGCGNGGWALIAAAAGFASYGIDINAYLIEKARENHELAVKKGLINPAVTCKFAVGNIYPERYIESYRDFALEHRFNETTMPLEFGKDPYRALGISLRDAGLIYAFPWEDQMPFLCRFLEKETSSGTMLALPHYYNGIYQSELPLKPLRTSNAPPIFVGVRDQ